MTERLHFDGIGAAFYPDQQEEELIQPYIDRLAEAGISFVRLAEFAWDKLEPEDGRFEFAWLDGILSRLEQKQIKAILCTPTAAPPIWMAERYGDFFPKLANGSRLNWGTRRFVCPTSQNYRSLSQRIARAMGEHYANDPRVIGWQIDNEVGAPFCFCERCLKRFQKFCRDGFGTIENFNRKLNTHFWGQTFQSFEQIVFPVDYHNPSMWQLYHRFFSAMVVECYHLQADELRNSGVAAPVSTNMMLPWFGYDHREMQKALDYVCADHYYAGNVMKSDFAGDAFLAAYLRGIKPETNIRYNEFQCSREHGKFIMPPPGEVRGRTLAHFALGADHICYFRWDACVSGGERDEYGLLTTPRTPGRIFHEVKSLGEEVREWKKALDGTRPVSGGVAFLYSYYAQNDLVEHPPCPELTGPYGNGYPIFMCRSYRALVEQGMMADVVFEDSDFSQYKVLIASALYVISARMAEKIREFVRNGGTLVVLPLSGIVDECGKLSKNAFPGPIGDVCGVQVVDHGRYDERLGKILFHGVDRRWTLRDLPVTCWVDEIIPAADTTVLAEYTGEFYNGIPAMTSHRYGQGVAYYVGTWFAEDSDMNEFYRNLAEILELPIRKTELPAGVYMTRRADAKREWIFLINYSKERQCFELDGRGTIELSPFDVKMLSASNG